MTTRPFTCAGGGNLQVCWLPFRSAQTGRATRLPTGAREQ